MSACRLSVLISTNEIWVHWISVPFAFLVCDNVTPIQQHTQIHLSSNQISSHLITLLPQRKISNCTMKDKNLWIVVLPGDLSVSMEGTDKCSVFPFDIDLFCVLSEAPRQHTSHLNKLCFIHISNLCLMKSGSVFLLALPWFSSSICFEIFCKLVDEHRESKRKFFSSWKLKGANEKCSHWSNEPVSITINLTDNLSGTISSNRISSIHLDISKVFSLLIGEKSFDLFTSKRKSRRIVLLVKSSTSLSHERELPSTSKNFHEDSSFSQRSMSKWEVGLCLFLSLRWRNRWWSNKSTAIVDSISRKSLEKFSTRKRIFLLKKINLIFCCFNWSCSCDCKVMSEIGREVPMDL